MLLSALLHIFVVLKRTIDQKLSSVLMSGPLNVAIACLMFFQFRFADTVPSSLDYRVLLSWSLYLTT